MGGMKTLMGMAIGGPLAGKRLRKEDSVYCHIVRSPAKRISTSVGDAVLAEPIDRHFYRFCPHWFFIDGDYIGAWLHQSFWVEGHGVFAHDRAGARALKHVLDYYKNRGKGAG